MLYTILVNWNGWRDTIACLESLCAAHHHGMTIVVCDNASGDDSIARLTRWAEAHLSTLAAPALPGSIPARAAWCWGRGWRDEAGPGTPPLRLVLLALEDNLGFAGGNNAGVALALADPACDYILLLNNDTEVASDALLKLEEKMARDPEVALCGATLVYHDDRDIVQGVGAAYNRWTGTAHSIHNGKSAAALPAESDVEPRLDFVIGAAMFARAALFRRTGGLSEDYFLYYEELDLSRRLLPGERMGWASGAVVAHKVGGSIGTGRKKQRASDLSIYYSQRSRIRYYRSYLPAFLPFLAFRLGRDVLSYARKGQFGAVRAIWLAAIDYIMKDKSFRRTFGPRR